MIVGIDLGTTFSAVGYVSADGPRLIKNALGDVLTPSVVGVDLSGELLVGRAARDFLVTRPDRCASVFKRQMGTDWTVRLGNREFTPQQLSAAVLRSLKEDAEAHLGTAVEEAVITVPAYFNEHQRKATIEAGQIAGLRVDRLLNEPTAAAVAYGLHEAGAEQSLVVIDLGGGTFDVSVVELFDGMVEVRASSGDSFLGGEDFTRAMAARVLESTGRVYERAEFESPRLVARLNHACESAKRRLSNETEAAIKLADTDGQDGCDAIETVVAREKFQAWTEPILRKIEVPIRRAVSDGGFTIDDIDEIILVGGATRMPAVIERVAERFGKQPRHHVNPDEVVAMGAAVQAGLIAKEKALEDLVVTDVAPFTLGIGIVKEFGTELRDGYMLPIIHRNTTIPISRVNRVGTIRPNQTELHVRVFQGENRRIENNIFLGEFEVDQVPLGPAGQEVDVRFTYDLNGVLEVEAEVVKTKRKVRHLITRHTRGMSSGEIERAVAEMQALKTNPREDAANRALLKRAGRVYEELPLTEQAFLGQLLDGFEEALELAREDAIAVHREAVREFLDRFDPEWNSET